MKMLLKPTPVPVFIQQTRAKPYESLNARGQIKNEPAYIYKKKKKALVLDLQIKPWIPLL